VISEYADCNVIYHPRTGPEGWWISGRICQDHQTIHSFTVSNMGHITVEASIQI
jgi:hypothetical protein